MFLTDTGIHHYGGVDADWCVVVYSGLVECLFNEVNHGDVVREKKLVFAHTEKPN